MVDLRLLKEAKTEDEHEIVPLLEALLVKARAGQISTLMTFSQVKDGTIEYAARGMSDAQLVFWLDVLRARTMGPYL